VTKVDEPAPTAPPPAPTGLTVRFAAMTQLQLAWQDNSILETGFEIQRMTPGGAWASLITVPTHTNGYLDTGLTPLATYIYRVRAVNAVGPSNWSNVAWADTANPPTAPTGLAATAPTSTKVNLSWTDNSDSESAFEIQRQVGSGAWTPLIVLG